MKELINEGMKEVVHLPKNCVVSKTDPAHTIPAKCPRAIANLLKKKFFLKFLSVRLP